MAGAGGGGGGGGGGGMGDPYPGLTDDSRDMGSKISTLAGLSLMSKITDGRAECCVGVRGDESTTEAGDASEYAGERVRRAW